MDRVDSKTQSSSAAAATAAAGININRQEDNKRKLLQLQVETGAQSLQTQLAHLYHHHQQNSSHSPYIDFQNVLYSQSNTPAASSLPKGSGSGPGSGLGASISLSSSSASNSPLVSQVNHISQAYSSPFSPVSPMTVPLDKPSRRRSVLTMGEALEPILATSPVLHLAQAQQTTQQPQSALQQPQQGSLALPQRNINANSKKRRDSIPYLPLHFDMEMQIDSVVPGPGGAGAGTGTGAGIGTRTGLGVAGTSINHTNGAGGGGHGSSTLTEFTKRRNWSQRIIEELQDLLCILTPSGKIRYTSPNTKHITGFTADELLGRMITEFVHIDDSHIFIREFNEAIASAQPLRIFFRFRRKDDTYAIFESNGHPHFSDQRQLPSNTATPVCSGFFMMARLYPTKNVALLDSFLEHKIENERLKRRIAELKLEEQEEQAAQARARSEAAAAVAAALNAGNATNHHADNSSTSTSSTRLQVPPTALPRPPSIPYPSLTSVLEGSADGNPATVVGALASNSMPPPAMPGQLTRQNLEGLNNSALRSDSLRDKMARYEGVTHTDAIEMLTGLRYNEGERSRGISTGDTSPSLIRGDAGVPISTDRESRGSGERKKKIKVSNEYVCTDCGTLDSPEWRKGPTGPKTLCNACGLRWAKKEKKRNSVSGPSMHHAPPLGGPVPPVPSLSQNHGMI
ncbi:blue light receptor [Orbilia oligospora]|uniref:Blue light receptor n=1 Tax=Orbilia oligospora TaxID=2813651 RepID=A0A7C8NTX5_ORBOL|nr:blue light receptor [Orbilia oligospora]KAF3092068.1 blue light receptor [Orbilia oligospora]KAF3107877.1 blue light receptor [Orbilia oligospora]KAF3145924.1 blue light receptor [Orbilia oligospora]KAF3152468.1 blue light receptor [Orbilia oligospora]